MAASSFRQPHEIPLPHSPANAKLQRQMPSRKGKGKAKDAAPKRRVQVSQLEPSSGTSWDWTSLTDSLVSTIPPIFTKDGSYFFSLVGGSVRIYAVTTGKVVSTLSIPRPTGYDASSDTLTCATLNPHNAFQLITGSVAGVLAVWDFLEATLLQIIDISQPIHQICVHENFKDFVFVTASRPSKKGAIDDNAMVLQVSLKPADVASQSTVQKSSEITPIGKIRTPTGLAFSPSGAWLVAIAGHKAYVASSASFSSGFTKYVSPERLTCLAFHPSEDYFATGDEKGNIRLWYCLNDQIPIKPFGVEKKTQTTTLHWHAHAVSSIAFTPNGAYLLSGGEESVLVIWQLHTGKREFLPRIGSPIKTISVSKVASGEEEYLLGLADATYAFVGAASLKISRSYSRIKLDPAAVHNAPSTSSPSTPLSVHSLTSTLILPSSHPSSLQIYSPTSSTLVSELEVSPSNRVSRRDEKPIDPCRIERAIVSPSSDWLATVDTREGDEGSHGESYLKIWWWDRKAGFWILNTRVDRPHGLEKVTDAAFSPSPEGQPVLLVTTGGDGNTKTWRIRTAKDKSGPTEEFWIARSTSNFQSESPSHVSWSPDASLLAITLPNRIALFSPSTNLLRHTLASPECGVVRSAHFIGKAGRYLAVVGLGDLVLWDLVNQRVRWHHKTSGPIRALVSHPREDTFAVVLSSSSAKSKVAIFQVNSAKPSKTLAVPFGFRNVTWYPLVSSSFSLVAITHDWKVVVLGDNIYISKDEGSVSREIAADPSPQRRTLFQDIFGKSAFGEQASASQPSAPASVARPWTGRAGIGAFDDAAYLLPPLESLFEPLMNGFLKPRVPEASAFPSVITADEDVDMDTDGDERVTLARGAAKRAVDQKEMGVMIELFKTHTLKAKAPIPVAATGRRNGLVNGHDQTKGGSSRVASNPPKPNGVVAPSKTVTDSPRAGVSTPPTPAVNGKKRKKSLG
ncbi:quinon protein alcohol dehydrogenase-like superfamily [Mycena rosella]|uniref:Quinon protein alcohol dehydrogenase-like superfamily n=1 Tax=Mycena rosella TaxID=1033263 RepID=A0AAD7GVB4_MYCRO|nr:quinon protein alcohol dehydrogenase-like superfamily [Mycena rosella]